MLGITDLAAAPAQLPLKLHSAEGCARTIADGIERNRAIITYTGAACAMWALYRLSPRLAIFAARRAAARTPLLVRRAG
jgi:hypothetical protein